MVGGLLRPVGSLLRAKMPAHGANKNTGFIRLDGSLYILTIMITP
jgi:hypothetical protein